MRKRIGCISLLLWMNLLAVKAQSVNPDWANPAIQELNTVAPHAWFATYDDEAAAIQQKPSPYLHSLDGMWKFKLVNKPADRPLDFFSGKYDVSQWQDIKVPANWQTEGFDRFIFTDVEYPIPVNPPHPPEDFNPVGSYKRSFTVPAGWKERNIFIRFGAVNSFFYLWINGAYVGLSKDSKTPAEFDITRYLRKGENTVSLQVFRFSDATYMEGQDMWKLSGIERSVLLIARPKLAVADFFVKAGLDSSYSHGVFDLTVQLNQPAKLGAVQVKLMDGSQLVFTQQQTFNGQSDYRFSTSVKNVKQWNAETPHLYTLIINQLDHKGRVMESMAHRTGFRTVEIRHGLMLVNGKAVKIKGVNRHEHDMYTAKVVTTESMLADIRLMKQYNINAVRTSHYPNSEEWYRLCDKYGIYVVDEANIECDGMSFHADKTLSDNPVWKEAYLHRTRRMFERDKNYCSIITWSLGNESAFGSNLIATYNYLKLKDDTRPVQYEGAGKNEFTDIVCPMYKSTGILLEYVKEWRERPLILCEYAHMMGNGGGNLKDYWDLIYTHKQLQGGFIWDFSDQTFKRKDKAGRNIWAYGRDMGNVGLTSDTSFCADGLFAADRTPHPQAFELKKIQQPIHFEPVNFSPDNIRVTNRFDFTDLSGYAFNWFIKADGKVIAKGETKAGSLAPQASKLIQLSLPPIDMQPGLEYFLTIEARTITADALLPENFLVAWEQFALPGYKEKPVVADNGPALIIREEHDRTIIFNSFFSVAFDKQRGWLQSYFYENEEIMQAPLEPHFWRAVTDSDIGNSQQIRCAVWKDVLKTMKLNSFSVTKVDDRHVVVHTLYHMPAVKATYAVKYMIAAGGAITVSVDMIAGKEHMPELPRFGMKMLLRKDYNKVTWLGRGPFDNYQDRNTAAAVDVYTLPADALFHPYARAQESGYRTDVRRMSLQNEKGTGLTALGQPLISAGVLHFNMERLEFERDARENNHGGSMANEDLIWWNIDYKQMGVGGDNSWGATPHGEYMLPYQSYQYSFILQPIGK